MAQAPGCRYLDFDESSTNGMPETHSGSIQMFHAECGFEKVGALAEHDALMGVMTIMIMMAFAWFVFFFFFHDPKRAGVSTVGR